jgi:glycosyltransferase involved in cell wall biosynthesis
MKKYYISSKAGLSGICSYSRDFYELVLKEKNYVYVDSIETLTTILTKITSQDHVHIEIGIFQKKEIEILLAMLDANYKNVSVTLHDPPLLKYPFYEFNNSFINKISKFYDIYVNRFGSSRVYLNKIKTIYVLSYKGLEAVKSKYRIKHVYFLPHIIDEKDVKRSNVNNNNIIYLGFIGRNKGIEYSLQLHRHLLIQYPEIKFYIIGKALGKEKQFYDSLKEKYRQNVIYLGYVPDEKLVEIFDKVTFSFMLFKNYRFFTPFSGSILYLLKKGKILFTNNVNAVPEVIKNGINGFYLSGDLTKDAETVSYIFDNKHMLNEVKNEVYNYLMLNHTANTVSKKFID